METIIAILIIFFSLIAWMGQVISAISYINAVKFGLAEAESDVDPIFLADMKGEAIWDTIILWILPVAGILFLFNHPLWIYFGLVGGGSYLYFAGRGIFVRILMQKRGIRIGKPQTVRTAYIFLNLWGVIALMTMFLAIAG